MAQITKSVQAAYGMSARLIPPATVAKLSQDELADRLAYVAELSARADRTTNHVIAGCYRSVAKAALTARPRGEVEQEARNLRAKAAQLGSGPGDMLLRQADELLARNPPAPRRAVVRKAGDPVSSAQTSLVALYDCQGQLYGVCEGSEIVPALDPDVTTKASSAGMIATHDPATGKPTGFVDPAAVTPVTGGTAGPGKRRKTGPAAAPAAEASPQEALPGDVPGRQVVKTAGQMIPAYNQAGRLIGHVRADQIRTTGR